MTDSAPELHLASSSPRRAEILDALGVSYSMGGVDVNEQRMPNEAAEAMVLRLAAAKAAAARNERGGVILAADTAVIVAEDVFGKPRDQDDALAMLSGLSGRRHMVLTGVAVYWDNGEQLAVSSSEVYFREIRPEEALAYWQSGEPRGKAGSYAIQGLGGVFVEQVIGSYSGVMGLPVYETAQLLAAAGIDVLKRNAQQ